MNLFRHLISVSTAISAVVLALLPIAVAVDFGGVLWWTQYAAALAILLAFGFSLPSIVGWPADHRPRQSLLLVLILLWLGYSTLQNWTLPQSLVQILSPASYLAYTEWLAPVLPPQMLPTSFPISIDIDETAHAVSMFAMIAVLAWTSLRVFNTRSRVIGLLSCIAISGAIIAVLGIVSRTIPGLPFFDTVGTPRSPGFATFVNRNNAALMLNFGLAASLGLLGWRLSALTGQEIDGDEFEFNELFALASDRDSAIGLFCAVLCTVGLLVCGSRAGIGTSLLATTISFGWLRRRKGLATIPVLVAVVGIASALLIVPLQLDLESIKRLELLSTDAKTLVNDGRLSHWPEGWTAAVAHFPGGSGLSTYGHAYLPFQNDTPKNWFVHADNIWLELIVEQGVIGISFAIVILVILGWCLTTIATSHDALDHGVRITGWYCLVAVVFSQCFDFGMIVPANLLIFTILMGAIVSRTSEAEILMPMQLETRSMVARLSSSETIARISLYLYPATVCVTVALVVLNVPRLKDDAAIATTLRTAQLKIGEGQRTKASLQDLHEEISGLQSDRMATQRSEMLGEVDHRLARLAEVNDSRPKSVEQATEIYQITSPRYRRLVGRGASGYIDGLPAKLDSLGPKTIANEYRDAVEHYQKSLVRRPLDPAIRGRLVSLDFANPAVQADAIRRDQSTEKLLRQLGTLYRSHADQLSDIALLAAQSRQDEMAAEYWNRTLTYMPHRTAEIIGIVRTFGNVDVADSLPKTPKVMRSAIQTILTNKYTDLDPILSLMIENVGCDQCLTVEEKSECLRMAGLAHIQIEQLDDAAKSIGEAVSLTPSNAMFRLELIDLLNRTDDRRGALREAQMGRQIDPSDQRFDDVIKQMADFDLRAGKTK